MKRRIAYVTIVCAFVLLIMHNIQLRGEARRGRENISCAYRIGYLDGIVSVVSREPIHPPHLDTALLAMCEMHLGQYSKQSESHRHSMGVPTL